MIGIERGAPPGIGTVLRVGRTPVMTVRVRRRSVGVVVVLLLAVVALGMLGLSIGDYVIGLPDVLAALGGAGTRAQQYVVLDLRLPRVVLAVAAGAALGVAGALFQSLARNPLAGPDLLGFSAGASTGAVVTIIGIGGTATAVALGAVVGTAITAVVVLALVAGRTQAGYRLVLVGIGVNAMLVALNNYLLSRTDLGSAAAAQAWLIGTLNGVGWAQVVPVMIAVVVAAPLAMASARRTDVLEMGEETALGLGVPVSRARPTLLVTAVVLVGAATAGAGPVAFVALCAPQLARRLTRAPGVGVVPAALMGALVLLLADVAAQHLFGSVQLPAGVITGAVGGLYLIWLLVREWRAGR